MSRLSDKSIDTFNDIAGERYIHLNRAMLHLLEKSSVVLNDLLQSDEEDGFTKMRNLFPAKVKVLGEKLIVDMMQLGRRLASSYSIRHSGCAKYTLTMKGCLLTLLFLSVISS